MEEVFAEPRTNIEPSLFRVSEFQLNAEPGVGCLGDLCVNDANSQVREDRGSRMSCEDRLARTRGAVATGPEGSFQRSGSEEKVCVFSNPQQPQNLENLFYTLL